MRPYGWEDREGGRKRPAHHAAREGPVEAEAPALAEEGAGAEGDLAGVSQEPSRLEGHRADEAGPHDPAEKLGEAQLLAMVPAKRAEGRDGLADQGPRLLGPRQAR